MRRRYPEEPPVVHTPQVGKAITAKYPRTAAQLLNNGHFHYVNEWVATESAVLEFTAEIDGIAINGVDIIWNADGRIVSFKVMVRPLEAIDILHQKMAEGLAGSRD